jgi:glycosyltransferase involved in cell wall biosynthesis
MDNKTVNSISIVVPVFNSEASLEELVARLGHVLPQLCQDFEVILINDGSRDNSWGKILEISNRFPRVKGINLMRNYGQHNALLCGIREARCGIVVTMDDDLQHPPEQIPILIKKLSEGFDLVYGYPQKLPHSFWRNIFSRITKRVLALIMGIKTVREISAFRAFRTDLRVAFNRYNGPGVIIDALLSWGTTKIVSVLIEENPRQHGSSNYTFFKLASQGLLVLTGFSTIPLRFASWLGFFVTLVGLLVFVYVLTIYFTAGSIPGFPFLASIISFFSGAQLFTLGIFGEYLARIFDNSMERPTYVIQSWIENGTIIEKTGSA